MRIIRKSVYWALEVVVMDMDDVAYGLYQDFRKARMARGLQQEALARDLGVAQPRIAELEARLRDGKLTKQMQLFLRAAAAMGLVPVLVPAEVAEATRTTDLGPMVRSTWDEVFVDLAGDDEDEVEAAPTP